MNRGRNSSPREVASFCTQVEAAKQAHLGRRKGDWLLFWLQVEPKRSSRFLVQRPEWRKTKQEVLKSSEAFSVPSGTENEVQGQSSAQSLQEGVLEHLLAERGWDGREQCAAEHLTPRRVLSPTSRIEATCCGTTYNPRNWLLK